MLFHKVQDVCFFYRLKITAVTYGMTLPKKYQTEMQSKLAVAQAQMEAIVARMNEVVSSNAEA